MHACTLINTYVFLYVDSIKSKEVLVLLHNI